VRESEEVEGATVVESSRSGYVESDISLVAIMKELTDSMVYTHTKVARSRRRLGEVSECREKDHVSSRRPHDHPRGTWLAGTFSRQYREWVRLEIGGRREQCVSLK
jgi:hypothetical protein